MLCHLFSRSDKGQTMLNNVLLMTVAVSLIGTVIVLVWINRRNAKSQRQHDYQAAAILRTIKESQPILHELKSKIAEMESLSRDSAKTPQIRLIADEAQNLVTHLDDLIVVQNLEYGLEIRQNFEKETAQ